MLNIKILAIVAAVLVVTAIILTFDISVDIDDLIPNEWALSTNAPDGEKIATISHAFNMNGDIIRSKPSETIDVDALSTFDYMLEGYTKSSIGSFIQFDYKYLTATFSLYEEGALLISSVQVIKQVGSQPNVYNIPTTGEKFVLFSCPLSSCFDDIPSGYYTMEISLSGTIYYLVGEISVGQALTDFNPATMDIKHGDV